LVAAGRAGLYALFVFRKRFASPGKLVWAALGRRAETALRKFEAWPKSCFGAGSHTFTSNLLYHKSMVFTGCGGASAVASPWRDKQAPCSLKIEVNGRKLIDN
jgi:hypothetical protein